MSIGLVVVEEEAEVIDDCATAFTIELLRRSIFPDFCCTRTADPFDRTDVVNAGVARAERRPAGRTVPVCKLQSCIFACEPYFLR